MPSVGPLYPPTSSRSSRLIHVGSYASTFSTLRLLLRLDSLILCYISHMRCKLTLDRRQIQLVKLHLAYICLKLA